ncbi:MAG: T9SS type A sorting domain-containing protein, partial [Chitinophagales bacterium]
YNLGPLVGSECDTLLTSINNFPIQKQFTIYPNPAQDFIFISGAVSDENKLEVAIYNLIGEKVVEQNNVLLDTKILLPELKNGIYEVVFKNKTTIVTEKLIVMH